MKSRNAGALLLVLLFGCEERGAEPARGHEAGPPAAQRGQIQADGDRPATRSAQTADLRMTDLVGRCTEQVKLRLDSSLTLKRDRWSAVTYEEPQTGKLTVRFTFTAKNAEGFGLSGSAYCYTTPDGGIEVEISDQKALVRPD